MRRVSVATSELWAGGAFAETAEPARRRTAHGAHRHHGRPERDQGKAEPTGEQQSRAGECAERRDECPHALGQMGWIGFDEAARREQPQAKQDRTDHKIEGHTLT